jgi:CheY-like chemotaxis protein
MLTESDSLFPQKILSATIVASCKLNATYGHKIAIISRQKRGAFTALLGGISVNIIYFRSVALALFFTRCTIRIIQQLIDTPLKTIYLADDDEDDRMLIREAIERVISDVKVIEVTDGVNLLNLLTSIEQAADPTLILMDMNMPRLNGLEALEVLKADPNTQHIPVLMMSTTSNHELVNKAYEEGINAYIVKPVTEAEFTHLAQAIDVCFLHAYHRVSDTGGQPNLRDTSIVVIEDNPDNLVLVHSAISQTMPDVKIIELRSREHIMEFFRHELPGMQRKPHLVLQDLYFPTRDKGIELLRSIREILISQGLLAIPLVVFSYSDDPLDIQASYRNKANGYMVKGSNVSRWKSDFNNLHHFWWNTVSFPSEKGTTGVN